MSESTRSKQDIHYLDGYIKWLANRKLMISSWFISMIAGVILSSFFDQWSLISRFGCIGIMIGTLLTLSPLFSEGIFISQAKAGFFAENDVEGHLLLTTEANRKMAVNILYGVIIIVASSIINAFGDLLGLLL
ncbi:hypothetical protein [Atlantibacter hermannii]|uniref:hypothetical protein n=1 Tax=Atlantibacter hermannii TaxID=565 RepID=UPI0030760AD9